MASGVAGPYRRLFAEPVLRGLVVADVCARLPQGMTSLTLLLVVAEHASMAVAGLVLAGYTLGAAVSAPVRGRLADRCGLFRVAAVCTGGYVLALLGLLACSLAQAPVLPLLAAGTAAGLLTPPLSPGVRSLWAVYAGPGLRQAAFALDAAVFDLCYLAGPVVASVLAAGLAPAAALGLILVLTATAVAAVRGRSGPERANRDGRERRSLWRPLRSAALRRLLVTAALTNAALAATEVALTAYARDHHALWASGPLLAGVAAGSITGSLLLGARSTRSTAQAAAAKTPTSDARPPASDTRTPTPDKQTPACDTRTPVSDRRTPVSGSQNQAADAGTPAADTGVRRLPPRLLAGYTAGLTGLTAAGLYPPLLALAAPLAGLCLGPALATLFSATADAAPRGNGTEAQAWINSIMNGGAAGGAALAGLAASSPVLGLSLATATAAAAAAAAMASAALAGRADISRVPQPQTGTSRAPKRA
jgi:MFS family permease